MGTVLDSHSTYSRNERCRTSVEAEATSQPVAAPPSPDSEEMCAVVVTGYEMKQQGKPRRPGEDATPEALRKRGLQSSGTWTSSGESLAYVSLATGLTVSVTQSGTEEMNMTIVRPTGGMPFHYESKVHSETHLTLLPEPAAPARPSAP